MIEKETKITQFGKLAKTEIKKLIAEELKIKSSDIVIYHNYLKLVDVVTSKLFTEYRLKSEKEIIEYKMVFEYDGVTKKYIKC